MFSETKKVTHEPVSSDIIKDSMNMFVRPATLKGIIHAPASKSIAQRLLLLSSLLDGKSSIKLDSLCDDIEKCAEAVSGLGAKVTYNQGIYQIIPNDHEVSALINCGESGTCFRMICSLCARFDRDIEITGHGSLVTRPMEMGIAPLQQLGAKITSNKGCLPLKVCGPLKSGQVNVDGSVSSQFLSGLLLSLPFCEGEFVVRVDNLKSKPYVQLTLQVLQEAGIEIHYSEDYRYFHIAGGQKSRGREFKVDGDWSSIATLLVAGAVAGDLVVTNVQEKSVQADRAVLEALNKAGAKLVWNEDNLRVSSPNGLSGFRFDAEDCPDVIPVLVALAVNCVGRTEISGAGRLKHKESDRASALCSEYAKVGGLVSVEGNSLIVEGSKLSGGVVSSHADHRIAMSLAIAALRSEKGIEITGSQAVAKSYPAFFEDLASVMV